MCKTFGLTLAAIFLSLAALPSAAHASGYTPFASSRCPYTAKYPAGWKIGHNGGADTFARRDGNDIIYITCLKASKKATLASGLKVWRKTWTHEGFKLEKVAYDSTHKDAIFAGTATHRHDSAGNVDLIMEDTVTLRVGHLWSMYIVATTSAFQKDLNLYAHMLGTVHFL